MGGVGGWGGGGRTCICNKEHQTSCVAAKARLEPPRKLGVSVRHVGVSGSKRINHTEDPPQRLVFCCFRLFSSWISFSFAFRATTTHSSAGCKISQMNVRVRAIPGGRKPADLHRDDSVVPFRRACCFRVPEAEAYLKEYEESSTMRASAQE